MDKIARNHAKTSRRLEWRRWRKAVGVRLRLHRMRSIARGACANWRMERGWRLWHSICRSGGEMDRMLHRGYEHWAECSRVWSVARWIVKARSLRVRRRIRVAMQEAWNQRRVLQLRANLRYWRGSFRRLGRST